MSASFTLSPPYKCNLKNNLLQPHTGPARFIHILINLYQFPNIYSQQIQQPQRHTHTTHTTTPPTPPHNHPHPHAHTPTHPTLTPAHTHTVHTYTTPNTLICTPSPHKHKTLHYNIFKVSTLLQYTYRIAVSLQLLHQHMNTILNIRTLIKVPFGSYRTNHHNAIRQPLS